MNILRFLIFLLLGSALPASAAVKTIRVSSAEELQRIFSRPLKDSLEIVLAPGKYYLTPKAAVEYTCANCEEFDTPVNYSYGIRISGRFIRLSGPFTHDAEIITRAGYGILIEDCSYCEIKNLIISGGKRDKDANASDAAIVAKNSRGYIRNNIIRNNIGDPAMLAEDVVGIMGIALRENTDFEIAKNRILRNSWDGIALFRNAKGYIYKNIVDGVDMATGDTAGGGRGVGIALTWNAEGTVNNNLVRRYWKGIGIFVDAQAMVKNNIVEDMVAWGITIWDAGKGVPTGYITRNIVYNTGACGISVTRISEQEPAGAVTGNIIVQTGQDTKYDEPDYYCYQCALAVHAAPYKLVIRNNMMYGNRTATLDIKYKEATEEQFYIYLEENYSERLFFLDFFKDSSFARKYLKFN